MAAAQALNTAWVQLEVGRQRGIEMGSSSTIQMWGCPVPGSVGTRGRKIPIRIAHSRSRLQGNAAHGPQPVGSDTRKEAVQQHEEAGVTQMDRRQLLLASSVAAVGMQVEASSAAPIVAPDVSRCVIATVPGTNVQLNCCPPVPTAGVRAFTFPQGPVKVRPAAHLATPEYAAKYARAYQLLKALPASDPRSFTQQANIHCAYCDAGYTQADGRTPFQFGGSDPSWTVGLFPALNNAMAMDRWYLYFHERILASLLGDPTFALPYWNWDNQSAVAPQANVLPALFINNPSLFDANRSPSHQPPTLVSFNSQNGSAQQIRDSNNNIMYQQMVSGARTANLFFGQPYKAGDAQPRGGGSIENVPHGTVHVWTGNENNANYEDMGNFYSAGRDPIFFAHHANIDRLWTVWKTLPGGRRKEPTDPDWLNSEFLFYDENKDLIRVKVGDSVDTQKLLYTYQAAPDAWKDFQPQSLSRATSTASTATAAASAAAVASTTSTRRSWMFGGRRDGDSVAMAADLADRPEPGKEKKLDRSLSFNLPRKVIKSRSLFPGDEDDQEEVLVIQGVKVPCDQVSQFDVFLNLPDADESTPLSAAEYVGTFFNIPHIGGGMSAMNTERVSSLRLGIGDTLKDLGIKDTSNLVVTLVPRGPNANSNPIVVTGFTIEYE